MLQLSIEMLHVYIHTEKESCVWYFVVGLVYSVLHLCLCLVVTTCTMYIKLKYTGYSAGPSW